MEKLNPIELIEKYSEIINVLIWKCKKCGYVNSAVREDQKFCRKCGEPYAA